jgi:hypothetical protein
VLTVIILAKLSLSCPWFRYVTDSGLLGSCQAYSRFLSGTTLIVLPRKNDIQGLANVSHKDTLSGEIRWIGITPEMSSEVIS